MSRRIETLEFRIQALGHTIETLSGSGEARCRAPRMGETKIKSVSCQVRAQPLLSRHRHPRSEAVKLQFIDHSTALTRFAIYDVMEKSRSNL